jgi:hypothetical protein
MFQNWGCAAAQGTTTSHGKLITPISSKHQLPGKERFMQAAARYGE